MSIPSVVLLRGDGSLSTGHAALQQGMAEPNRVAREFKRRMGDPAPILLAGSPMAAHVLMARFLKSVIDRVAERLGEAPETVTVTHPANWGEYKRDYLRQTAERAGLNSWHPLSEPEAAAFHYAARDGIEPGETVAVYDLGGGTFDAAILRSTDAGFVILGQPHGIENLGGVDFDEALFEHTTSRLADQLSSYDPNDPAVVASLRRLRADVETAKITLSSETDTAVPVILPGHDTSVRVTRAEFEALIRPPIEDTIDSLQQALESAGTKPEQLAKVLLVGGSSRIPLVAQMITDALDRPVAVDTDPKHAVALGAAGYALGLAGGGNSGGRLASVGRDEVVEVKDDSGRSQESAPQLSPQPTAPNREEEPSLPSVEIPPPPVSTPSPPTPELAGGRPHPSLGWVTAGGAAFGVGSFMPWATIFDISENGFGSERGWFTLSGGIALAVYGIAGRGGYRRVRLLVAAWLGWLVATAVTVTTYLDIYEFLGFGGIGIGMWVMLGGSIVGLAALFVAGRRRPRTR